MGEGEGEADVTNPSPKPNIPLQIDEKSGLRTDGLKGLYLSLCTLAEKDWTDPSVLSPSLFLSRTLFSFVLLKSVFVILFGFLEVLTRCLR